MPIPDFKPGDLIDANQLKAYFIDIEKRLADLEKNDDIRQGQVFITRLLPVGGVRIGEELIISGGNFYVSRGAARVSLNDVNRGIKEGSTDTEIKIDIPVGTPIGRATVEVTNSFTAASQTTEILPAVIPLEGDVVARFLEVKPTLIETTSGQPIRYVFTYELDPGDLTREATYTVTPTIVKNIPTWQQSIRIIDLRTGQERKPNFRLLPSQKTTFGVRLDLMNVVPQINSFTLRVDVETEGRKWSLADRTFKNNENVLPADPSIEIGAPNVDGGIFDDVTNTITGITEFNLPVIFTRVGVYKLIGDDPVVPGLSFTNSTVREVDVRAADLDTANGRYPVTIRLNYRPAASAAPVTLDIGYGTAAAKTVDRFTFRPS